jgi:serine/threonine-protein kinase
MAVKYLSPRLLVAPGFVEAFRSEAALLRTLDVPQVVRLFDYVEAPGHGAAIIMELVSGASLHDMITRQGPAGPQPALAVLKGSLLGLAAAHALGIVHRDYKPENVLVDGSGQSKLTDFGIAARAGQAASGGTPLYMAPEQWEGAPASPATDIYAVTAVFFECLTGTTPFTGTRGELGAQHAAAAIPVEAVDEPLRPLIARGMAKNPADRPVDAGQFIAEMESAATAAYGADWEPAGRAQLAARAAALSLLYGTAGTAATGAGTGTTTATTWLGAVKSAIAAHAILYTVIAAAVVGLAGGGLVGVSRAMEHAASSAAASSGTASAGPPASIGAPSRAVASASPAGTQASATPGGTVPSGTPAASGSGGAGGQAAIGPCPTSGLKLAVDWGAGQAAAERFYVPLEFTNTSGQACTLDGYPGVALTTSTTPGSQVGAGATRLTGISLGANNPPAVVTLDPGATASATLQLVNVGVYSSGSCGPVPVSYLEVYPPGQTSAAYVPYTGYIGQACSKPVYQLGISTVEAGTAG